MMEQQNEGNFSPQMKREKNLKKYTQKSILADTDLYYGN